MEWRRLRPARERCLPPLFRRLPVPRSTLSPRPPLVALLLAVTACGDSSSDDTSSEASGSPDGQFPVTVTGDNGDLTLDEQPETIVSMSATATEMLFAIGAGDQVEAVDS